MFPSIRCSSVRTSAQYCALAQVMGNPGMKQRLACSIQFLIQVFKLVRDHQPTHCGGKNTTKPPKPLPVVEIHGNFVYLTKKTQNSLLIYPFSSLPVRSQLEFFAEVCICHFKKDVNQLGRIHRSVKLLKI